MLLAMGCGSSSAHGTPSGDGGVVDASDAGAVANDAGPTCLVCAGDGATPLVGPPMPGPVTNTVAVDPSQPAAAPVPDDFLGISVEWATLFSYLGGPQGGIEPEVAQLVRNFEDEGHHLVLRVAGNSGDRTYWAHKPPGLIGGYAPVQLGAFDMSLLADWHARLPGSRFIIGLNLVLDDPNDSAVVVQNLLAQVPLDAMMSFEIGNEPDLYAHDGNRPSTYNYATYKQEFEAFHDGLLGALAGDASAPDASTGDASTADASMADASAQADGSTPVVPPTLFSAPDLSNHKWYPDMPAFFSAETNRLTLATTHQYASSSCPGVKDNVAPSALLSDCATVAFASPFPSLVQAAHAAGLKYRMDEMNSIPHGGVWGVSNLYAAALWSIDVAFQLASIGMDGINFHTPGNKPADAYAVFDTLCGLSIRPLYYGMRVFSLGTAQQGRLVPVTATGSARVRAWATLGSDGAVRVVLVNEDLTGNDSVALQVPGKTGAASLVRLSAAGLDATCGLSLGMQTWDGSLDGKPVGSLATEPLANDGSGGFTVPLPALEAVVVTLP
jgi:hypothetical protein